MRKLTPEEIRAITFGAVRIEETAQGLCFYRCTQRQIAVWYGQVRVFGERAESATGIRLDFHTDAGALSLSVGQAGKYEVMVNGLLRAQYVLQAGEGFSLPLDDPLGHPLADKRVTVCFPNHQRAVLTSVALDSGTAPVPHGYDSKILFLGDSITQGTASDFDSLSYAWQVARHFNADMLNQGIGGTYFLEDAFDRLPFDPDTVIVAYGTNDFSRRKTTDELRTHASGFLARVAEAYAGRRIFVITPIWRGRRDEQAMGSFEDCRAVIAGAAESLGLRVIDGLTLVPPLPVFFADGYLHPNDCGMALYAGNLIRVLEKLPG